MDVLWPAIGISIIVGFVFYILAVHWGRVLQKQAWTIRRLSHRVETLEEVENPRFLERINESAPSPLEQVFTFSFRFSDRFWRETLHLSDGDWSFVRSFGSFVGSIKLERWRSHTIATINEVLPDRKTAAWQTRMLDYYPGPGGRDTLALWDLALAQPANGDGPPALELVLRGNAVELYGHRLRCAVTTNGNGNGASGKHDGASGEEEALFFRVPLDATLLGEFRSHDPAESENGDGLHNGDSHSWRAFYSWRDDSLGVEWHLRVLDLNRKADWERWKILDSPLSRVTSA